MQQQERMESGPAPVQDHAAAQIRAFRRHTNDAVSAAREQNQAAALKALERACNAFTGLAQFLRNRTAAKKPLHLQPVNQPLMAARNKLRARRWGEALPQIDQMLAAGLAMIRALGGQIADDDTTPDGSPRGPTNAVPSAPPPRRDRPLRPGRYGRK
jgi:hypothetical protein